MHPVFLHQMAIYQMEVLRQQDQRMHPVPRASKLRTTLRRGVALAAPVAVLAAVILSIGPVGD